MSAVYGDKTVSQWIASLQFDDVPDRCAAALALAEFAPGTHVAKAALHQALNDMDASVQGAVEVALGFVRLSVENRRKMFRDLCGGDELSRQAIMHQLALLARRDVALFSSSDISDERFISERSQTEAAPQVETRVGSSGVVPDIAHVTVLPWWFLLSGVAVCLLLAWLMRGVSSWKWAMAALTVAGILLAYWAWNRSAELSPPRLRARLRLAVSLFGAGAGGLAILLLFPSANVFFDNHCGVHVRVFLDDQEWLMIESGGSKGRSLTQGKYRVTIYAKEGDELLDAHDIEVSAYDRYILNVLGAQVYFQGVVQYGGFRGGAGGADMKIVTEKWFRVPEVDYLFRDMPSTIQSPHQINKTFLTKGMPPQFKAAN